MARDDIATRLRAARPGLTHRGEPLSARALAELEQYDLLARTSTRAPATVTSARGRRHRARLVLGSLAMTVVVVIAALTVWGNVTPEPAMALTPAPLRIHAVAGTASSRLAAAAQKRRDDDGTPDGTTVRSHQWALESSVADDGTITSQASVPQRRTLTFGPDGDVTVMARAGAPFPGEVRDGLPAEGTLLSKDHYAAGHYDNPYNSPPPTGAGAVGPYFATALGVDDPTAGDYLRAVGDLLSSRPITAPQEAALLQFLARQPGLRLAGTTTDRLDRAGQVFIARDRRPGEYEDMLVVGPATGKILDLETVYIGHDRTDIPSPATTVYVAWER